jgi:hypothetical protein
MDFPLRISPLLVPLLLPVGVAGPRAFARVDEGKLRVVFGVLFDHTFPLEQTGQIGRSSWPWWSGFGLRVGLRQRVGLIGALDGVVAVHFREPQRVRVVVPLRCSDLYLSVVDPHGFIATAEAELHKHAG